MKWIELNWCKNLFKKNRKKDFQKIITICDNSKNETELVGKVLKSSSLLYNWNSLLTWKISCGIIIIITRKANFKCFQRVINVFSECFQSVFKAFSRCFQGVFKVFLKCFQCVFKVFSKCFQRVFNVFSKCFQSVFKVFSMCFQSVFKVFSKCFQCVFKVFSKCFQSVFKVFSMCCDSVTVTESQLKRVNFKVKVNIYFYGVLFKMRMIINGIVSLLTGNAIWKRHGKRLSIALSMSVGRLVAPMMMTSQLVWDNKPLKV